MVEGLGLRASGGMSASDDMRPAFRVRKDESKRERGLWMVFKTDMRGHSP